MRIAINDLNMTEIQNEIAALNEPGYRAKQIFKNIHGRRVKSISEFNTLPNKLINRLEEDYFMRGVSIFKRFDSKLDKTSKFLMKLDDGNIVESVFMKYHHGNTVCISSQIGCKMGCVFCASTKDGKIRDLEPSEMLGQFYEIERELGELITNIVLMGSGEPLDNFENVIKFINIISDEEGKNLSKRNITLSTCGVVDKIIDLAELKMPINLSLSLHSPFDEERKKIMPIARAFTVKKLIDAMKQYQDSTGRRVTIEYTLIDGVNNRDEDLKELTKIITGIKCNINLIPLNQIKEYNKDKPNRSEVEKFKKKLEKQGINVTIRRELGSDISASCGQLRNSHI